MPELPEVEHARRRLARHWIGRRIRHAHTPDPAVVRTRLSTLPADALPHAEAWLSGWVGQRVEAVLRRGKRLGIELERVGALAHLGMTGRWIRRGPDAHVRHGRLRLELDDDQVWWFEDPRRFGCLAPAPLGELEARLGHGLGPDALIDAVDAQVLAERLGAGKAAIKNRLMDQSRLAGIGNIQASEALWKARIHPATRAARVGAWGALADGIQWTLQRTLDDAGEQELVYLSVDKARNPFLVYGRAGQPCARCAVSIEAVRLSGRVSPFCPRCQPLTGSQA